MSESITLPSGDLQQEQHHTPLPATDEIIQQAADKIVAATVIKKAE
jgi:hypothetical protein